MSIEPQETDFMILQRGADDPDGPYNDDQILNLLKEGIITKRDYVFFEGMEDWKPLEEVFEIQENIEHFIDDGQDEAQVVEAHQEVGNLLSEGEEIYYIAIQARAGILTKTRQYLVVTNLHMYQLNQKSAGFEIEALPWSDVSDFGAEEGNDGNGTFSFLLSDNRRVDVPYLPMAQVIRLCELSGEMKAT